MLENGRKDVRTKNVKRKERDRRKL